MDHLTISYQKLNWKNERYIKKSRNWLYKTAKRCYWKKKVCAAFIFSLLASGVDIFLCLSYVVALAAVMNQICNRFFDSTSTYMTPFFVLSLFFSRSASFNFLPMNWLLYEISTKDYVPWQSHLQSHRLTCVKSTMLFETNPQKKALHFSLDLLLWNSLIKYTKLLFQRVFFLTRIAHFFFFFLIMHLCFSNQFREYNNWHGQWG